MIRKVHEAQLQGDKEIPVWGDGSPPMEQRSSGGNYPAITQEELQNILIPIPPLDKQLEIVNILMQYEIALNNFDKKPKQT